MGAISFADLQEAFIWTIGPVIMWGLVGLFVCAFLLGALEFFYSLLSWMSKE